MSMNAAARRAQTITSQYCADGHGIQSDPAAVLSDLLADLMVWAEHAGLDWDDAEQTAARYAATAAYCIGCGNDKADVDDDGRCPEYPGCAPDTAV
ncbi:hypothetical protein [Streptomyces sp. NPDC004267]|uniref:hypothetical protein n=1 Tax=Streptomyces sp. NPDC004267 TaxID=3364694 RepID=UPI0036BDFA11